MLFTCHRDSVVPPLRHNDQAGAALSCSMHVFVDEGWTLPRHTIHGTGVALQPAAPTARTHLQLECQAAGAAACGRGDKR